MAFDVKNTLEVTKSAVAQLIGKGYMDKSMALTELNDQYLVDLGEALKLDPETGDITTGSPADLFFKALIGQVGKIVVDTRSYVAQLPKLFVDPLNWGIIAEYVKIDISDVMADEMWNPEGFINWSEEDGSGVEYAERITAMEHACYKPVVSARIYKKAKGIMVALTVAREQMFTAFTGVDQLNSFIAGLYNSVENTLQLKAEVYALMTVSMGIAKARANGNEINLLTEYNTETGNTLTAAKAFEDADFLRFAARYISETKDNIRRYTALYNNHESITFAPEANTILLNKFSKAMVFNLQSNIYHDEKVGLGDYDTVSAWQAVTNSGTDKFTFATAGTISLTTEAAEEAGITSPETNKRIDGVVGVIYDRYAMGITIDKKKVTSSYTAVTDYTNYFHHSLVNYIVNDNYPIVSFVVRDAS